MLPSRLLTIAIRVAATGAGALALCVATSGAAAAAEPTTVPEVLADVVEPAVPESTATDADAVPSLAATSAELLGTAAAEAPAPIQPIATDAVRTVTETVDAIASTGGSALPVPLSEVVRTPTVSTPGVDPFTPPMAAAPAKRETVGTNHSPIDVAQTPTAPLLAASASTAPVTADAVPARPHDAVAAAVADASERSVHGIRAAGAGVDVPSAVDLLTGSSEIFASAVLATLAALTGVAGGWIVTVSAARLDGRAIGVTVPPG